MEEIFLVHGELEISFREIGGDENDLGLPCLDQEQEEDLEPKRGEICGGLVDPFRVMNERWLHWRQLGLRLRRLPQRHRRFRRQLQESACDRLLGPRCGHQMVPLPILQTK